MKKDNHSRPLSRVWTFFTSVKLTVVVLLLVATTSIIGTLIPQNAAPAFYVHKYGEALAKIFMAFDFFDMYHSWWFLLLMGVLGINIVVCSIHRLNTTWKIIFPQKVKFSFSRFQKLKNKETFQAKGDISALADTFKKLLEKRMGQIVCENTQGEILLFSEKGRWTRIGVYIVHASVLLLLLGAVIGGVFGYKGFVAIPEGETATKIELRGTNEHLNLGFDIRCNTFSVSFYDTGAPEEFKSNLTIVEDGKEVLTTDIVVNDPLRYKGISLYQSSYGTDSASSVHLSITSNGSGMVYHQTVNMGENVTLPEAGGTFTLEHFLKGYNFRGHNLGESFVGKVTDKAGKEISIILPMKFSTFDKMRRGRFVFQVEEFEKRYYTGLQVTYDPGVWYVYTGFIFMIVGCWVTFFMSHQSICIQVKEDKKGFSQVQIFGTANKNNQAMKIKIKKFATKLKGIVS